MDLSIALKKIIARHDLDEQEMREVMTLIMNGLATHAQIGGFLVGLRMKGETITEIAAAASVMRALANPVTVTSTPLLDTCGTGGDGAQTFNISTAVAFVAAAAGAKVAKHGNRSISSKSGSADVLEAAGVNLDLTPEQVATCIEQVGVGFMFAPRHHAATRHVIAPRREMGVRTLFNLLGPLTNPARAPHQLIGVFSSDWLIPFAEVTKRLGSRHVLVVHAEDGLDEISCGSETHVAELINGNIITYTITPEQFGMKRTARDVLQVNSVAESLALMQQVLANIASPALDIVTLNAGAAIYAADLAPNLASGLEIARQVIANGSAYARFNQFVQFSRNF